MLSIGLVRVFNESEFAGYGIAMSIALFCQAIQRGFNIQASLLDSRNFLAKARGLLGAHLKERVCAVADERAHADRQTLVNEARTPGENLFGQGRAPEARATVACEPSPDG